MKKLEFKEIQRIDSIWPLSILAISLMINWVLYFISGHREIHFFYVSMVSVGILCIFFMSLRLQTKINQFGIQFKFFPFHFKWTSIEWSEIKKSELRTYSALKEFGGWGLRFNSSGKAYIVNGKHGLQLTLRNGKKILIGTNQVQALENVLLVLNPNTIN